jgi:squalene monooxygenase
MVQLLREQCRKSLVEGEGGPHTKEGLILLDDEWNMRHPLTGGDMTVALSDVVLLTPVIAGELDLTDWHALMEVLHR